MAAKEWSGPDGMDQSAQSEADAQLRRSRWVTALETLSPIWFTLIMNTGILGVLMHQLPYQFRGLGILSTIMFVLALILMLVIFSAQLVRVIIFPHTVLKLARARPDELCLYGCCPIAFMTVTALVALVVPQASWGGHAFTLVAYVMWWASSFVMLVSSSVILIAFAELHAGKDLLLPTSVFIPAVGCATDALIGGVIATYAEGIGDRLATPMIVMSWVLLGYAFFVGLALYVLTLQSFFMKGFWLPPAKWPTLALLTGPMGQCAAAILLLASAAKAHLPGYDRGTFLTSQSTTSISSTSVILALMFLGFDLFWVFITVYILTKGAIRKAIPFTLGWWGTVFPVATISTTTLALSIEMDSPAFRVICTGVFLILLVDYFVCWAGTIWGIWTGRILDGRQEMADLVSKDS